VAAQPGPTEVVSIIEFYNANLNHYFMTGDPREIVDLDTGVHAGWVRTGLSFRGYAPLHGDDKRGRWVVRYYGLPSAGLDSHFYTWSIREVAGMRDKGLLDVWQFEGSPVFEIPTPDPATGECQTGTLPVYRLWNQHTDSNHRYTTDPAIKQQMINLGWTPEGYGPDAVFMCALIPTALSITKSQSTSGTTLLNLSGTDSSVCVVFDATSSAITSNIISIHTLYHMNGCIGEAPRGVVNITTDVGLLAAEHYTVTWETDGQQARTEFDVP